MLLSRQVTHSSNSSHLFWNHRYPALVQTLCYRRKIAYHPLLIGFFHKLISRQDIRHYIAFTCSSTAAINLSSCNSKFSPNNDKDAKLNRQFPFGFDLKKILPDLFRLKPKTEKPFSRHT